LSDVLELSEVEAGTFDMAVDGRCLHCIIGKDRARFLNTAYRVLKPSGILLINTMCNEVPKTPYWQEHFDPATRCTLHGDLATRYIGDSNDILQEIISASFRILHVKVLPPKHEEDLADLQVIAEKR
jgi:ubiquinone/menaquinone biosynthesis C-methylase UbiE